MTSMELLTWARGTGLQISIAVLIIGVSIRLLEILSLGRKVDLSEARVAKSARYGWRTVLHRFLPSMGCLKSSPVILLAGYSFHVGLFLVVFFYVPHILVFSEIFGISWPGLPFWLIDAITLITIASMGILMLHRYQNRVRRFLSRFDDYYSWTVTLLPLITGYFAYHRLFLPYTDMLLLHVLSVEVLLISIPFTKLIHAFTFLLSRWYTGEAAGRKGVKI